MKFKEARKMLEDGKKVRRKSWSNKDFSLPISLADQEEGIPYLSIEDIDANDWEVVGKRKFCKQCKQEIFK